MRTRIAASFARQSLMHTLGARLKTVAQGEVSISAAIDDHVLQQHGFAHAGLTFAIGDSAAGYAALSLLDDAQEVVTAEMKINLLAPAKGNQLVAKGRVIKPGRRLIVVAADVYAHAPADTVHVATLMGTMVPVAAG